MSDDDLPVQTGKDTRAEVVVLARAAGFELAPERQDVVAREWDALRPILAAVLSATVDAEPAVAFSRSGA
jgi:hypothetical protein